MTWWTQPAFHKNQNFQQKEDGTESSCLKHHKQTLSAFKIKTSPGKRQHFLNFESIGFSGTLDQQIFDFSPDLHFLESISSVGPSLLSFLILCFMDYNKTGVHYRALTWCSCTCKRNFSMCSKWRIPWGVYSTLYVPTLFNVSHWAHPLVSIFHVPGAQWEKPLSSEGIPSVSSFVILKLNHEAWFVAPNDEWRWTISKRDVLPFLGA